MLNRRINDLTRMRKTLFGTELKGVTTMVVTPMKRIYSELESLFQCRGKGWWETGFLDDAIVAVKGPTGTHCEDIAYFAPDLERMIFVGYCGGISSELQPGEIFSPENFISVDGKKKIKASIILTEKIGDLRQVYTLHEQQSDEFLAKMKESCVDALDMECYGFMRIAQERAVGYGGIYMVSDNVVNRRFYTLGRLDYRNMSTAQEEIINLVMEEVGLS